MVRILLLAISMVAALDEEHAASPPAPSESERAALEKENADYGPPRLARPVKTELQAPVAAPWNAAAEEGDKIERVEGIAKTFDCQRRRLLVEVGGKIMAFGISNPAKVVVLRHNGGDTFEFTCGPLKPFHVVVDYAVPGTLRSLTF